MDERKAGVCLLAVLMYFVFQYGITYPSVEARGVIPCEQTDGVSVFLDRSNVLPNIPGRIFSRHNPEQRASYARHAPFPHDYYASYLYYWGLERNGDRNEYAYRHPQMVARDIMDIGTVQKKLNSLGYDCGVVNGVKDSQTLEAIEEFQRDYNLFEGGIIGLQSRRVLESFDLKSIQTKLKQLGYDCDADGVRDFRTIRAIQDFQNAEGLDSTGVINKTTKEAIDAKGSPYFSDIVFVDPLIKEDLAYKYRDVVLPGQE